jgi:hypothetical protein
MLKRQPGSADPIPAAKRHHLAESPESGSCGSDSSDDEPAAKLTEWVKQFEGASRKSTASVLLTISSSFDANSLPFVRLCSRRRDPSNVTRDISSVKRSGTTNTTSVEPSTSASRQFTALLDYPPAGASILPVGSKHITSSRSSSIEIIDGPASRESSINIVDSPTPPRTQFPTGAARSAARKLTATQSAEDLHVAQFRTDEGIELGNGEMFVETYARQMVESVSVKMPSREEKGKGRFNESSSRSDSKMEAVDMQGPDSLNAK